MSPKRSGEEMTWMKSKLLPLVNSRPCRDIVNGISDDRLGGSIEWHSLRSPAFSQHKSDQSRSWDRNTSLDKNTLIFLDLFLRWGRENTLVSPEIMTFEVHSFSNSPGYLKKYQLISYTKHSQFQNTRFSCSLFKAMDLSLFGLP